MSEVNRRSSGCSQVCLLHTLVHCLFYVLENLHGVSVYFAEYILYLLNFIAFFGPLFFQEVAFCSTIDQSAMQIQKNLSFQFREFLHEKCAILGPSKAVEKS